MNQAGVPSPQGFWILFGTTAFQIGYPILLAFTFSPHRVLSITALVFIVLAGFSLDGFLWARIVTVLLCALITLLLLWVMLQDFLIFGSRAEPNNFWPLLLIQLLLPALGYGACAFLLLFPSVTDWQRARRDRRIQRYQLSQRIANLGDTEQVGDLNPCPWCEAPVLRGREDRCPACDRPV
jgi:hypothetical protein